MPLPSDSVLKPNTILGVDPGSTVLGYSVIRISGNTIELMSMGVVQLQKYDGHFKRLAVIHEKIGSLIKHYSPDVMAIEAPFFGKNVQSMLKLGRAQGSAIAAALGQQIEVFEYAPRSIKQAITGNGNASKEQVAGMLQHLVPHEADPSFLDATDALATAVCHHYHTSGPVPKGRKGKGTWAQFIKDNPERTKN
jgi:crossover junction endodeoxyribonuclease RuvC